MNPLDLSIALASRLLGMAKVIGDEETIEHIQKNLDELLLLKNPKVLLEDADK